MVIRDIIAIARPRHYVKNLFIFTPLFFGGKLLDVGSLTSCLIAFISFCFLSSSLYIFNDLRDIQYDKNHAVKKDRPLANGRVSKRTAYFLMAIFAGASVSFFPFFTAYTLALLFSYFVLNILYSVVLKGLPIIDITCIAIGFVLRIFIGMEEADIGLSNWLIIMTFLLAMLLGLAKRRDDLLLVNNPGDIRKSLNGYTLEFVSACMVLMAGVTIVCYILFTTEAEVIERYGTQYLYLTGFWVILGILRYLQIALVEQRTGDPVEVFLTDRFIQIVFLAWILCYLYIIYFY
jgi:decaprenyl-phosphate phosphoribosyltransferase